MVLTVTVWPATRKLALTVLMLTSRPETPLEAAVHGRNEARQLREARAFFGRLGVPLRVSGKLVVAVGDCGCSGGIFGEGYASCGRVANVIPVDVTVAGCTPAPIDILRGILTAVRRCRVAPG